VLQQNAPPKDAHSISLPALAFMRVEATFRMHMQTVYRLRADQERRPRFRRPTANKTWEERDVRELDRFDCAGGGADDAGAGRLGV
jgi:hypothetical protein